MGSLLHSYWYERIMLNFAVADGALRRRLPHGWSPSVRAGGSNITIGFCEVWHDEPATPSSYLYIPVNGAAQHEDGTSANMRYLTISDRPEAIGGCTVLRAIRAQHTRMTRSNDGDQVVQEAYRFDSQSGVVSVELEYVRDAYPHIDGAMRVLCPDDARYVRRYDNEELQLRLRGASDGVDRVRMLRYEIRMPELKDLFDGTEQLVSVASIPTSRRRVSTAE